MSKAVKTIGKVAGVVAAVALIGSGVGVALGGAGMMLVGVGSAASIATVAGAVSGIAALASSTVLKSKQAGGIASGSVSQVRVEVDAAQPYVMGEGYFGGVLRHDSGYGGTVDEVSNPYRGMVVVYTGSGPVQSISPRVDYEAVPSWYSGFLYTDTQLGACPESSALTPNFAGMTGWDNTHKLSGQAAILWNLKFDKEGQRFASGIPLLGAYGQWVKVYDPRKDSTQPGGSGSHRLGQESTYEYSESPALHAGMYAYGRYQNGKRVMGIGLPRDGINWRAVMAWANVCSANGWTIFGPVYEPGDRWANLKEMCKAGGGKPIFSGAVLSFRYYAPVLALDTITEDDLTGEPTQVPAMQSFRDRINTVIPKYRSPDHNWEIVSGGDVSVAAYVTADGGSRRKEEPFNLVKKPKQAAELGGYALADAREITPISIPCSTRLREYQVGECLHINLPARGIVADAIIQTRRIDPQTMNVAFTFISETPSKHAFALGRPAAPPPTGAASPTSEERDTSQSANNQPLGYLSQLIANSYVTDADPADGLIQATSDSIYVEGHTRTYTDKATPVSIDPRTITRTDTNALIVASTTYHIYYDSQARQPGVQLMKATKISQDAATSGAHPNRHYVGTITTDVEGGTGTSGGGATPPGWGGGESYCVSDDTLILLADGEEIAARDLQAGQWLRTQHEDTREWGQWPVEAIRFATRPVFACQFDGVTIRATGDHRFMISGQWVRAASIGTPDGEARVALITVTGAHTYVSAGVLSHNVKAYN